MDEEWISTTKAAKILNRTIAGVHFMVERYAIPVQAEPRGKSFVYRLSKTEVERIASIIPRRAFWTYQARFRLCKRTGYRVAYNPNHPRAMSGGQIYEHWVIMEEHLGRDLTPEELVVHKNKIKHDNRLTNLELHSSRSEFMKVLHRQRIKPLPES